MIFSFDTEPNIFIWDKMCNSQNWQKIRKAEHASCVACDGVLTLKENCYLDGFSSELVFLSHERGAVATEAPGKCLMSLTEAVPGVKIVLPHLARETG